MKFIIPRVDLRDQRTGGRPIVEETTDQTVGQFFYSHGFRNREVSLYGKYSGSFESHEECVAFARGVAAVLSHMTRVELKE